MYRFEIFRDSSGGYRWRLMSSGYVVAVGDPRFKTADSARQAVRDLQGEMAKANLQGDGIARAA